MSDFEVNLGFHSEEFVETEEESNLIQEFFTEMDGEVYQMVDSWLMNQWDEYKSRHIKNINKKWK
jgi:hypothetical protein